MKEGQNRLAIIFGKKLAELRKSHHLSQYKLADEIGMSRSVIAYYETYSRNPSVEAIQQVADFFQVPPESLISEGSEPEIKKTKLSKLEKQLEKIKLLPKDKQKMISNMLEGALQG